jgi:predicted RNA binding protein YcfA (HicA-like mRNA interferase family)
MSAQACVGAVKVGAVLKRLYEDGWYPVRASGGHRQLKHPWKAGRVTVAGKPSDELHPKTEASILQQAGSRR